MNSRACLCGLALLLANIGAAPLPSKDALSVERFTYQREGWGLVEVRNLGSSGQSFDFHQLRGLEYDTQKITRAGDVRFELKERASYWVEPGQLRRFRVYFSGGMKIVAVSWEASGDLWRWRAKLGSASEVTAWERAAIIEWHRLQRTHKLKPVQTSPLRQKSPEK